jgi:pyruvate/2-oxoglutarate/acetoin dehydrogenase E1 component
MMEMQFADFVTVGFNQIINNLAKIHYRWGQNADVVIRMPTGGVLVRDHFILKVMKHGLYIHRD